MQDKRLINWIGHNSFLGRELKSHTSMDGVANKAFSVPSDHLESFLKLYTEDILHNKRHYISEYAFPSGFPLFIDLDLKLHGGKKLDIQRDLGPMLKLIQAVVTDTYGYQQKPEILKFVVVTRPPRKIDGGELGETTSYGFHIHYVNLNVSRDTAIMIRSVGISGNYQNHPKQPEEPEPFSGHIFYFSGATFLPRWNILHFFGVVSLGGFEAK